MPCKAELIGQMIKLMAIM